MAKLRSLSTSSLSSAKGKIISLPERKPNILVLHGPNLNLLGNREPSLYGTQTLEQINMAMQKRAHIWGAMIECFQSNAESELINHIQTARNRFQGIVLNAAAYTHTSIALRDALEASGLPTIEVHLSNIYRRESFRHISYTAAICIGQICGLGPVGYELAIEAMIRTISRT